jgi:LysW-gamma-L-lysine carboxypeptidase
MMSQRAMHLAQTNPADAQTAIDLLVDLVTIPSPSYHEAEAVRYLVNWMQAHGYDEAFVDEVGNAVGIIGTGSRDVVLLGHIDTFGGALPVRLHNGILYGRGAVDAKGSLATFAVAGSRAQLPDDVRLIVIGAVEEEVASSKGAAFVATQYQPELVVIGEPSGWERITLGYKGRLVLDYTWQGALAHSSSGVLSPAEHAVAYWDEVRAYVAQWNANREGIFARLDATLQAIHSEDDGVYGRASAQIGLRLPVDADPDVLVQALQPTDEGIVHASNRVGAHLDDKNSPLSRVFRQAIRGQGGRARFVTKTGTSDMNIVAPIWQCPIVAYGPGDSQLDHTPDEHLPLSEYLQAIAVLQNALGRL